jgi:nucleoside 2-deoxyribosyltransferase
VNLYVIGKFEEKRAVRQVMDRLRHLGHNITHDWTLDDAAGRKGEELESYLIWCAEKCLDGVMDADALVFLVHPKCQGAHTEVGLAIAWGRPVYTIGMELSTNIFLKMPKYVYPFKNLDEVLAFMGSTDDLG